MTRLGDIGKARAVHPLARRDFLVAAFGTGAAFGFAALSIAAIDPGAFMPGTAAAATGPRFAPTLWFSIDKEGIVTVNVIRAEMGQHVGTALARILADELEADWDKVRILHCPSSEHSAQLAA